MVECNCQFVAVVLTLWILIQVPIAIMVFHYSLVVTTRRYANQCEEKMLTLARSVIVFILADCVLVVTTLIISDSSAKTATIKVLKMFYIVCGLYYLLSDFIGVVFGHSSCGIDGAGFPNYIIMIVFTIIQLGLRAMLLRDMPGPEQIKGVVLETSEVNVTVSKVV